MTETQFLKFWIFVWQPISVLLFNLIPQFYWNIFVVMFFFYWGFGPALYWVFFRKRNHD